jgi:antitoxin MazE
LGSHRYEISERGKSGYSLCAFLDEDAALAANIQVVRGALLLSKRRWYTYSVSTEKECRMLRKIFRTGNSMVVSIPKDILDELQISEGEEVSVEIDSQQRQIVISPVAKSIATGIDETFAKQVDDFIEKYRPALESLAK